MFDEPKPQNKQGSSTPAAPSAGDAPVGVPTDLPIEQPSSPSSGVDSVSPLASTASMSQEPPVEDMFEGISEPKEAPPLEEAPSMASESPKKSKSLIIGALGLLVVALLGIGGWYFYASSVKVDTSLNLGTQRQPADIESRKESRIKNVNEEPIIEESASEEPAGEEPVIEEPVIEEPVIEEPVIEEPVDTDGDGLLDADEKILGTDPFKIDTDEDGLFDREEVQVYGTDPQDPDSDGDGYLDGEEVKKGYDPLGTGKLFDIP